jgi:hypothetical protein
MRHDVDFPQVVWHLRRLCRQNRMYPPSGHLSMTGNLVAERMSWCVVFRSEAVSYDASIGRDTVTLTVCREFSPLFSSTLRKWC